MICAVMQPTSFPWIGYFDLIDSSDIFVFYDDVQFVKQSWQVRNRIKTANNIQYINIYSIKNSLLSNINEIKIDNSKPWRKKLLKTLFYAYKKSTYFEEFYSVIEKLLNNDYKFLSNFNQDFIILISEKIGIETKFHKSSDLPKTINNKDKRLVEICNELGCDTYLSTPGASDYIELIKPGGEFTSNNIKLLYQNYTPVEYDQLFGNFEP